MRSRTVLRWLLLVQALAAGGLAWTAMHYGALHAPWLALAAGVLAVLLVRLVITANNFAMSARFASATPDGFRLTGRARLHMFFEEYMATMLHSSWFMAFDAARERIYPAHGAPPVLLLHGYGCNAGYWTHFVRKLDSAQISHASLDLEPVLGAIDDYVPGVASAVESLCAHSGAAKVIIVAHSMGGLVARAYLREHGGERVAHVFTLGTPHHGTSLASFGIGRNAAQMRRGAGTDAAAASDWLRTLADGESAATRALITSIYTHHDNIVAPQTSSVLPGARHIEFGGVGHVALGRNPRVLSRLMQEVANFATR